jgi:SAM-dependent methyltransferase
VNKLDNHEQALRDNVFFTKEKWPQFNLLFDDIKKISKETKKNSTVIFLERAGLYGNISLFAPFFNHKNFISIDCSSGKISKRGAYNKKYVTNKNIIKVPINYHFNYKNIKLKNNCADMIAVPNLLHHIFDYKLFFNQCKKILKKDGKIYIFEPLIRELHQKPDDYFRFTPFSLREILKQVGFKKFTFQQCGGPFTASSYCLDQAIQFLPKNKRDYFKKYFLLNKEWNFQKMDKKYKKNLVRKNSSFPVSFSLVASF